MRLTLPFVVVRGWNIVVTRGDKTMRECLDVGRILKEKLKRLGKVGTAEPGLAVADGKGAELAREQGPSHARQGKRSLDL